LISVSLGLQSCAIFLYEFVVAGWAQNLRCPLLVDNAVVPIGTAAFLAGAVRGVVVLSGHSRLLGVLFGTSIQTAIFYSPCACVCEACGYVYMRLMDMEKYKGGWPYYWINPSKTS
jgi:hypothetical protein